MTPPPELSAVSSVWDLIDTAATKWPAARMFVDDHDRDWTFAAYRDACLRMAARLSAEGIDATSTVSWQLPTTVEALTLLGALSRLGARQNPLIPVLRDGEMRSILEDVAPDLLIVPRAWRGHDHETMAADLVAAHGCRLWVLSLDGDVAPLGIDDVSTLPGAPSADADRWVYTSSGSTGRPKTIVHSDASVIASARAQLLQFDLGPSDVFPVSFPVAHIGGMAWLVTSWRRGTQLLLDSAFDPSASPERMARHGATILGSATPFFAAFLEKQRQLGADRLFPDLRFCMGGGAPIPTGLHDQVIRELGGLGVFNGYGLTECPILGYPTPESPADFVAASAFVPAPGVDVEIRDDEGTLLGEGVQGELWARGPQSFAGYLDPDLTAATVDAHGFIRTGDLATIEAGHVRITGRIKDVIIRNGENISALEVETALTHAAGVAEVAVVGLPDPRRGESVCAVVVPTDPESPPTLEQLATSCADAGLAAFKRPEHLRVVEKLPRSPMGKLVKPTILALVLASDADPATVRR